MQRVARARLPGFKVVGERRVTAMTVRADGCTRGGTPRTPLSFACGGPFPTSTRPSAHVRPPASPLSFRSPTSCLLRTTDRPGRASQSAVWPIRSPQPGRDTSHWGRSTARSLVPASSSSFSSERSAPGMEVGAECGAARRVLHAARGPMPHDESRGHAGGLLSRLLGMPPTLRASLHSPPQHVLTHTA